jgi:hypothetical protein
MNSAPKKKAAFGWEDKEEDEPVKINITKPQISPEKPAQSTFKFIAKPQEVKPNAAKEANNEPKPQESNG